MSEKKFGKIRYFPADRLDKEQPIGLTRNSRSAILYLVKHNHGRKAGNEGG